jgi:agmatinase
MRLPNVQTTEDVDFAVIGIPFDTACSFRTGSRFGPASIRHISAMIRPYNMNLGVKIFDYASGIDYGDIPVVPGYIEDTYERIEKELFPIVDAGVIPICLGGDHSITLGELRAIAKKYGPVALVHFDSHLDTWDEYFGRKYNHGTPFKRALEEGLIDVKNSIQVGMRGSLYEADDIKSAEDLGFKVITANQVRKLGFEEVGRQIRERVGDSLAFFTFDIDFVDPAYAPGTGTIEVGGFTSYETLSLIWETKNLNFVGFDIVEVLPAFDPTEITAYMAANVGFEFASIVALRKKKI